MKTRPVCECVRVRYTRYTNYIASWWGLSYITSPELFHSVLFLKRWMFSVPDCDFSFLLSLHFHTMFITRSNRSEWMRRINQTVVAGLCIPWKARFSDLAQSGSHSLLDRLRFTLGLSEISVLAGNCVGLGRWSAQSPSSVLCLSIPPCSAFHQLLFHTDTST